MTPYEVAAALRPAILAAREANEEARRLAPELVDAMADSGLFRVLLPADVGGQEAPPLEAYEAFEELARADASVAWIAWNNGLATILSRSLDAPTRREIFGDPRAVFANSTRPSGVARPAEGGFRLSGRWALVSGCELASWIPLTATVEEAGASVRGADGRRDARMFFVPKGSYEILDTWYTGGLRGTGSHDVVVDDVLVPEPRALSWLAPAKLEGALFRFPFAALLAPGCASICLGIARSALDALIELAKTRPQVDPGPPMRERPRVHESLARVEAALEAARMLLRSAVEEAWHACADGAPDERQRGRLFSACVHAAHTSKDVVGRCYETGGTASLYVDRPIERCQRDIWAVCQHMILSPVFLEQAGRVRLGLEPTQALF